MSMLFPYLNAIRRGSLDMSAGGQMPDESYTGLIGATEAPELSDETATPPQGLIGWMQRFAREDELARALAPIAAPGLYAASRMYDAAQDPFGTLARTFDPRSAIQFLDRAKPGNAQLRRDPVTGDLHWAPFLKESGDIASRYMPAPPRAFGGGLPGPTASAPVTALRQVPPSPPGAGPDTDANLGDRTYHLPPNKDLGEDPGKDPGKEGFHHVKGGGKYWPSSAHGPLDNGKNTSESFRSKSYYERVLDKPTTLYRVWGGGARQDGTWWSRTPPAGKTQVKIDDAILPEYQNAMERVTMIRVPAGTTIFEGPVAQQGDLVGGGWQVYIPEVDPSWELQTWDFR